MQKKFHKILTSRGIFYWFLVAFLVIKIFVSYLSIKDLLYLDNISEGFVSTLLFPSVLIFILFSFATFIRNKKRYILMSLLIDAVGTCIIYGGILYYRLNQYFIFYPRKIIRSSTFSQHKSNWLDVVQLKDFIYVSDFCIILIVIFASFIFNQLNKRKYEAYDALVNYRSLVEKVEEKMNSIEIDRTKNAKKLEENVKLNADLIEKNRVYQQEMSDLEGQLKNSNQKNQKDIAFLEAEYISVSEGINQWQKRYQSLLEAKEKSNLAFQNGRSKLETMTLQIQENQEEKENLQDELAKINQSKAENQRQLQRMIEISKVVYDEMKAEKQQEN